MLRKRNPKHPSSPSGGEGRSKRQHPKGVIASQLLPTMFTVASIAGCFLLCNLLCTSTKISSKGEEGISSKPQQGVPSIETAQKLNSSSAHQRGELVKRFVTPSAITSADDILAKEINYTVSKLESTPAFPLYGTDAFSRSCGWTKHKATQSADACTIFARPTASWSEGMSAWMSILVSTHIRVQQMECQLFLDYGPKVNFTDVLLPHSATLGSDYVPMNWTVPRADFECTRSNKCTMWFSNPPKKVTSVPNYRFGYSNKVRMFLLYKSNFTDLLKRMPDFDLETGMACSLGSLLQYAPTASRFEPLLFTKLLPTLRSPSSFVITLYIRTGQTDQRLNQGVNDHILAKQRQLAEPVIRCALALEERQGLSQNVVWMVGTDSPKLKEWIRDTYGQQQYGRQVLATSSRGKQSKTEGDPSTRDFAEAMIDWMLMGESNVVVAAERYTFGGTAALRTARPYYRAEPHQCLRVPLLKD